MALPLKTAIATPPGDAKSQIGISPEAGSGPPSQHSFPNASVGALLPEVLLAGRGLAQQKAERRRFGHICGLPN